MATPRLPPTFHRLSLRAQLAARRLLGTALFQKLRYLRTHHRWPRTGPEATFTEKVFARKVGADDARFPIIADKVAARDWVARRIGPEYLVPLVAVYEYQELKKLDLAPGQVIKCANRSGGVYFTSSLPQIDRAEFIENLRKDLDFDFASWTCEPWYASIPKRVIVEKCLSSADERVPDDYKFMVFHGVVKAVQVHVDRFGAHQPFMLDPDWNLMFPGKGHQKVPPRPASLARMIDLAEALGKEFDFMRVDLYEIDGRDIYFGEMTIAPGSGIKRSFSAECDKALGALW